MSGAQQRNRNCSHCGGYSAVSGLLVVLPAPLPLYSLQRRREQLPFYSTQLGRFGEYGLRLMGMGGVITDPDLVAAHLYAANGSLSNSRPNLDQVLETKGLWNSHNLTPEQQAWRAIFGNLQRTYRVGPLTARCPNRALVDDPWPDFPPNSCAHEVSAPFSHWNLCGFSAPGRLGQHRNTIVYEADTAKVDSLSKPILLYIVSSSGDILIGPENYRWIKHVAIA